MELGECPAGCASCAKDKGSLQLIERQEEEEKEEVGLGRGSWGVAGTISTRVRRHNLSMFAIQPRRAYWQSFLYTLYDWLNK